MKIQKITKAIGTFLVKNSPYILSGTGVTAIAIGTVILVKKARKAVADDTGGVTFDEAIVDNIECARHVAAKKKASGEITEKQERKIIVREYTKSALRYIRYYGAPVMLIAGGVTCMFSAMMIQTKRLKVISAAYTALAASFNEYRDRVKAVVGEEKENDIFRGTVRDEKGNVVSEKPLESTFADINEQEFSRLFGEGNTPFWSKNTSLCLLAIQGAESNINQLLRYQGFVTLNDLWKELGMRPSEEGMYIGWRWKHGDPKYGETYIDLGFSGPKNQNRCEDLKHAWNEEIWINVVPPHVLFGKLPKEVIRSRNDKIQILKNRRKVVEQSE